MYPGLYYAEPERAFEKERKKMKANEELGLETNKVPAIEVRPENLNKCPYCGGPAAVAPDCPMDASYRNGIPMVCESCGTSYTLSAIVSF